MTSITNPKVLAFYNSNKHIDINKVNELFVDLMCQLTTSTQSDINQSTIHSILNDLHTKISKIEDTQQLLSNTMIETNTEFKQSILSTVLETLQIHSKDNSTDMKQTIETSIQQITQNLKQTILSTFPENNSTLTSIIHKTLSAFNKEVVADTLKLANQNNKQHTELIIHGIGDKCTELQNTISDKLLPCITNNQTHTTQNIQTQLKSIINIEQNFQQYFEKQMNSSVKGKESEQRLISTIAKCFPEANIVDTTSIPKSADLLLERSNAPIIIIENKDYAGNVPNKEIQKFLRDVQHTKHHGILLSQNSGVCKKKDMHIDICNNNIIIYVHHVNYDQSKILLAVNIIDNLSIQIEKYNKTNEQTQTIEISQSTIKEMHEEYQKFIQQKLLLHNKIKDFYQASLHDLEVMDMPQLKCLFIEKCDTNAFVDNIQTPQSLMCKHCNKFTGKTNNSLAKHVSKCKSNPNKIPTALETSTKNVPENIIQINA